MIFLYAENSILHNPKGANNLQRKKNFVLEHVCGMPLLYKKLSHDYVDGAGASVIGFQGCKVV